MISYVTMGHEFTALLHTLRESAVGSSGIFVALGVGVVVALALTVLSWVRR